MRCEGIRDSTSACDHSWGGELENCVAERRSGCSWGLATLAAACQIAQKSVAVGTAAPVLARVGGRVVPGPEAPAIVYGVVVIEGGAGVGARADVRVPPGARVLDCAGATVSAGFWNTLRAGRVIFERALGRP